MPGERWEGKPLFIPLKRQFFEAFRSGNKTTEYRKYGDRWNIRTCYPGRRVVLSLGYGKGSRITGVVADFNINEQPNTIPGWSECYGETNVGVFAACIGIRIDAPLGAEHKGE